MDPSRCFVARFVPVAFSVVMLSIARPPDARGQYMYLDSNADGIHSPADQVNPSGATSFDVYLQTDRNRDGSAAVCPTGELFTLNSYVLALRATDGTIAWTQLVNLQPTMTMRVTNGSSPTELADGYAGSVILPPGLYRLATVSVSVLSGSPSIDIVPRPISVSTPEITSFGSRCDGLDWDNTLKLGSDWFDTDGLIYGASTPVNHSPSLTPISDMSVAAGAIASQGVTATDPDAQFLTLTKSAGPSYMAVLQSTMDRGEVTGLILLAPLVSDVGSAVGTVSVTDGDLSTEQSFGITVAPALPGVPALDPIPNLSVLAGTVHWSLLYARDPDGEKLTFQKLRGPRFVAVSTLTQGIAASTGALSVSPTLCDVGSWDVEIAVGSGSDTNTDSFRLDVLNSEPPPSSEPFSLMAGRGPVHVRMGDLNEDRIPDAIVANSNDGTLSVFMGRGNGALASRVDYAVGRQPWFSAIGDWNQDGHLDVAVACVFDGIWILMGAGDGTLHPSAPLVLGEQPISIAPGDLNRDGLIDLVFANRGRGAVSVLLGTGGGAFGPRIDFPVGGQCYGVTVADFNRDGRPDVVSANWTSGTISFLPGYGDGTFGIQHDIATGGSAFSVSGADFNHDGLLDLVVANYVGSLMIFLGNGDGSFLTKGTLLTYSGAQYVAAEDFDGDGISDLAAAGQDFMGIHYFAGLGGGEFGQPRLIGYPSAPFALDASDLDSDGKLDLVTIGGSAIKTYLNPGLIGPPPDARAFLRGNNRGVDSDNSAALVAVRLEPKGGTYSNGDVVPTSASLISEGTGSVDQIFAVSGKAQFVGDLDRNGIEELSVYFRSSDMAKLFDQVQTKQLVNARLEAALKSGKRFCASLSIPHTGASRALAAAVSPNPLNPEGILSFRTTRDGFVRVRLFDAAGRLVRVLADLPAAPAGSKEIRIDGRTERGLPLASGIYFYRIDSVDGSMRGRVAVLK